jgi:hypothetical protein
MIPIKFKEMYIRFTLLGIFAAGIDKEEMQSVKTSNELLTQKTWKLASHGYDLNNNKNIDADEENIQACEKDNTYSFYASGTGLFEDNTLSCGNGISEHVFRWRFVDQEKALDFVFGALNILKLDENVLILYNDETNTSGQITRHISIYTH